MILLHKKLSLIKNHEIQFSKIKKISFLLISFFIVGYHPLNAQPNAAGYDWKSVKIGGGGFVTGIITCAQEKNLIYARTDVGGAYRWVEATKSWKPLTDWASKAEWTFLGIESIAIDPSAPKKVYLSAGLYSNTPHSILRSNDYGETFQRSDVSFQINGNGMGRNNGERLAVDPNNGQILFCGSRSAGLWKSSDGAVTWTNVSSFPVTYTPNGNGISCISFDELSGNGTASQRIFVGVSRVGADNVYVSEDGGTTWKVITGEPTTTLMPQRMLKADNYLYITYADFEGPYNPTKGAAYRYDINVKTWKNIAPDTSPYSGVTVDASNPTVIMLSTINIYQQQVWAGTTNTPYGDKIYRSTDGGTTWTNLCLGNHLKAEITQNPWIGNSPQLHWVSDIRIDPFNSERVMLNSGNGLFMTDNISAPTSTWTFQVNGLEEMVPLDMVSIPNGPFISVIGDYNGFIHTDPTISPAAGAIKSAMGTTTGIDFAENNPNFVVVVGNNNCKYTTNQGNTWSAVSTLPVAGASSGSVAVSADGGTIYWYPDKGLNTYYTKDKGATWKPLLTSVSLTSRPVADRVNANKVYSYVNSTGLLYTCTFNSNTNSYTYTTNSVGTWGSNIIRSIPGIEGDVWIPLNGSGLKHCVNSLVTAISTVSTCDAVGFGKAAPGKSYPTIYIWGTPVGGVLGIHCSDDMGISWMRINDDTHEFGGPGNGNYVMGDWNVYGRAFMSTAGRGIVYGEITPETGVFAPQKDKANKFYPNPTSNILYSSEYAKKIEIFGLNGLKLLEKNESEISVSHLQSGCYIARLHTDIGIYNQLIVKK
jgi:xyloglucan-specific exo-beta-1,4-glucanase